MQCIPVIIPAYEPDKRLLLLLRQRIEQSISSIVIVNDGSSQNYNSIIEETSNIINGNGKLICHNENKGKGSALKTAFGYILSTYPNLVGTVTADLDGQHTV